MKKYLILAVLLGALAVTPVLALINGGGGSGSSQFCYNFNTNLGVGSSGDDVMNLITALHGSGFPAMHAGTGMADAYGEDTAAAVVQFQAKYGISQTGYVGPLTRAKLNSLYGCGVNPIPSARPTISRISAPAAEDSQVYTGEKFAIEGANFSAPDSVYVGNELATVTQDASVIWAVVPSDLTSGLNYVYVKNSNGTSNPFNVTVFGSTITSTQSTITSISPNTAMVGQAVTVTGTNLGGFEGDKYLWIENSAGQKGVIYGNRDNLATTINFTLASSYCTADNSYSGLPCPSYITITPGAYNIYTVPWGNMSNKVSFTVAPGTTQAQPSIIVTSPNGGETCQIGRTCRISWSYNAIPPDNAWLGIAILKDGREIYFPLAVALSSVNYDYYDWLIPADINNSYITDGGNFKARVRIYNYLTGQVIATDDSDNYFTITPGTLTPTPTPAPLSTRSFKMGFVPIPAQPISAEHWLAAFDLFGQNAEVVMQHVHFSPSDQQSLAFIDGLAKRAGLQTFTVIDPLGNDRTGLDPDLAKLGKTFADPAVRQAYQDLAVKVAHDYQPVYLSLGSEINTYLSRNQADASNFVSLINETVPLVKQASPQSIVTASVQYEELAGKAGAAEWSVLDNLNSLDAIAFTTYPSPFFPTPADLPADYYSQIRQHTQKPLLIAESGWPTDGQVDFINRLPALTKDLNLGLWIWWFPYDWSQGGYAQVFTTMGLHQADGTPKPGWPAWQAIHNWPRLNVNATVGVATLQQLANVLSAIEAILNHWSR